MLMLTPGLRGVSSALRRGGTALLVPALATPTVAATTSVNLTTASFTPPANCLLVAVANARASSTITTLVHSGGSLTWTQRALGNYDIGSGARNQVVVSTAPVGGSPSAMTVTSTRTSTISRQNLIVIAVPLSAYVDAAAIAGNASGDVTPALASAPGGNNLVLAGFGVNGSTTTPLPTPDNFNILSQILTTDLQTAVAYAYGRQSAVMTTANAGCCAAILELGPA